MYDPKEPEYQEMPQGTRIVSVWGTLIAHEEPYARFVGFFNIGTRQPMFTLFSLS